MICSIIMTNKPSSLSLVLGLRRFDFKCLVILGRWRFVLLERDSYFGVSSYFGIVEN